MSAVPPVLFLRPGGSWHKLQDFLKLSCVVCRARAGGDTGWSADRLFVCFPVCFVFVLPFSPNESLVQAGRLFKLSGAIDDARLEGETGEKMDRSVGVVISIVKLIRARLLAGES